MTTRFDLETDITNLHSIADDLDTLASAVLETDLDKDDIVNAVIGLAVMTRLKVDKTFDTFKAVLHLDEYKFDAATPTAESDQQCV
jgi:hypothetical protein